MPEAIGTVVLVQGARVVVSLQPDIGPLRREGQAGADTVGQVGSYVLIDAGGEQFLVLVTAQRRADAESGGQATDVRLEGLLVGALVDGAFEVGVTRMPVVGDPVRPAGDDVLRMAMEHGGGSQPIVIGSFAQSEIPVTLDVNRLLGMHTAVLGTTGSGKSYTVARIVQEIEAGFPAANVVVFDLHGEYARSFGHVRHVRADTLKLPAWLHAFEHIFELFADYGDEQTAHSQRYALRTGVYRLKQDYCRNVLHDELLAEDVDLDAPIPFGLEKLLNYLHNLNNETRGERSGALTFSDGQPEDWFGRRMRFDRPVEGQIRPGYLRGQLDRLIMRVEARLNDPRYAFMFRDDEPTPDSLERKTREITGFLGAADSRPVTVFDLSQLPNETIGTVVATISRVIFQAHFWSHGREHTPTLVVYEEAHNYIARVGTGSHDEAREAVERIAKEGRKFGIGTLIVSQRPSELSETLMSQCNTFLCMRMGNPLDREYVASLLPGGTSAVVDVLSALPRGQALAIGRASGMPVRLMVSPVADPSRAPDSHDVDFVSQWSLPADQRPAPDIAAVCDSWVHSQRGAHGAAEAPAESSAPAETPSPADLPSAESGLATASAPQTTEQEEPMVTTMVGL